MNEVIIRLIINSVALLINIIGLGYILYITISDKVRHDKEIKIMQEQTKKIILHNAEIVKNNQEILKGKITFPLKK